MSATSTLELDLELALPCDRLHKKSIECPHCKASLVAQEIPAERRAGHIPPGVVDDGRPMFYTHLLMQSSMLYDRILAYTCPFCEVTDVIPGCEEMWDVEMAAADRLKARQAQQEADRRSEAALDTWIADSIANDPSKTGILTVDFATIELKLMAYLATKREVVHAS